jgi:hypothetical protein
MDFQAILHSSLNKLKHKKMMQRLSESINLKLIESRDRRWKCHQTQLKGSSKSNT